MANLYYNTPQKCLVEKEVTKTMIKQILKETHQFVERRYGVDSVKNLPQVLNHDDSFKDYISSLAEGMSNDVKRDFMVLSENIRQHMLAENYVINYTPYQGLTFPILRVFFPRLVARDAITVKPIDKPEYVMNILRAVAIRPDKSKVELPSINAQVTALPNNVVVSLTGTAPRTNTVDLLAAIPPELVPMAGGNIERRVILSAFTSGTVTSTNEVTVNTNDGTFTSTIDYGSGNVDRVYGTIDFATGTLRVTSEQGLTDSFNVYFTVNIESNTNTPTIELKLDRISLIANRRALTMRWSPDFEQDLKAMFDLDVQAELVNWVSQQIAIEIDSAIINDLIFYATAYGRNNITFQHATRPASFALTDKEWYASLVVKFNEAAANIYSDTYIGLGNVILMNPLDAQYLQALDIYTIEGVMSGDMSLDSNTVQVGNLNNRYKVLVSSVVPKGKAIMTVKPAEETGSVYIYAPYQPLQIVPLPYGNIYSLTMFTRNAFSMVRPQGIYVVNITA